MHRIDDPTAVPTLPAPRPQGSPGYFTGGSPGTGGEGGQAGFLATRVRYEFMNALQEELAAIVEAAEIALDKTANNQVLAALRAMLRFKLQQDATFYVSPTGDDANDGLTPQTPLRTGQAGWNKSLQVDLNGHNLYLQFANGTYPDSILCLGAPLGIGSGNNVVLAGNVAQPDQVVFAPTGNQSCVSVGGGARVFVTGVTLRATGLPGAYGNAGMGLVAETNGSITFGNVDFDLCEHGHMQAISGGIIQSVGNPYRIIGGGQFHMSAALGSYFANVNSPVAITGSPAFSMAFAWAQANSTLATYGTAYSGAATGPRFLVQSNSIIETNTANVNYLPGNAPGVVEASTYGVYQ